MNDSVNNPKNWDSVEWSEVLDIRNGRNQKAVVDPEGKYPIYGSGGIMGYANDYLCESGSTIIGRKGSINSPIFVSEKFWNVDTAFGLSPKENLDNRFLYYFCIQYNFLKHNKATTLPSLTKRDLLKIQIPLPPLEEQKRIAGILDAADALRTKRRETLEQLDQLAQSTFLEMFGDPVTNPKGWEVLPMERIFELKHGFAFKSDQFRSEGEYVLLTPGNFFEKGGFRNRGDKQRYLNEPVPKDYVLDRGDLLVAMTEQAPGLLGSPIFVPESNRFLHNQRLGKVVLRIKIELSFIFELMNTSSIRGRIQKDSTGTKVKHTSPKKIGTIECGVPPLSLQKEFALIIESIEKQKERVKAHLKELDTLFSSLQSRAFKGEL